MRRSGGSPGPVRLTRAGSSLPAGRPGPVGDRLRRLPDGPLGAGTGWGDRWLPRWSGHHCPPGVVEVVGLAAAEGLGGAAGRVTVTVTTGRGLLAAGRLAGLLADGRADALDVGLGPAAALDDVPGRADALGAGVVGVAPDVAAGRDGDAAGGDAAGGGAAGGAAGGGGAMLAAAGEPSTVTKPSALSRRKAGFGLGTRPWAAAAAASAAGACLAARSRVSCCSRSDSSAFLAVSERCLSSWAAEAVFSASSAHSPPTSMIASSTGSGSLLSRLPKRPNQPSRPSQPG